MKRLQIITILTGFILYVIILVMFFVNHQFLNKPIEQINIEQTELENVTHTEPPPGFTIIKNQYDEYAWKSHKGYISIFKYKKKQIAIEQAWAFFESRMKSKSYKWIEIE